MKHTLFFLAALLLMACTSPSPVIETPAVPSSTSSTARATLPPDPEHGELAYLGVGALNGNEGSLANGTGIVWVFGDGFSRVSMQLNIAAAPVGMYYIAWLQDTEGKALEKLGTLENDRGDVRHSLKLEAQKDYKRYPIVLVTRESSEGVSTPGKIVAKGILKDTRR